MVEDCSTWRRPIGAAGGVDASLLTGGEWILVLLPMIYVPCGLAVGRLAAAASGAATAFRNSTGLPIVILTVVRDNLILVNGKDVTQPPNAIAYLALYLLFYPCLQW
eukprot:gene13848-2434_t